MSGRTSGLYAFGPYRLDVVGRVLTHDDHVVPLPPKAFELLLLMVESPGRAFSKRELMTALWPNTFVEEANLSFQISMLRKGLGDPGAPWIETVPKHGYRFAAEVKTPTADATPAAPSAATGPSPLPTVAHGMAKRRWPLALAAASVLAGASYVALWKVRPNKTTRTPPSVAVPLTSYHGFENTPSLSADGSQVAFSWNGPTQDNYDIYVKLVGPGPALRMTTNPTRDDNPAWSPDGRLIAFQRFTSATRADVIVIPALGGAERRLATGQFASSLFGSDRAATGNLSWTPDGNWIACGGGGVQDDTPGIWLIAARGSGKRRLTEDADWAPTFSQDGRYLAFIRGASGRGWSVYVLPLSSEMTPAGPAIQVTAKSVWLRGLAWFSDGRGLVFSSAGHLGMARLQRIGFSPGSAELSASPELLPFGEQATAVSISRTGRLVYSSQFRDANIWRVGLTHPARSADAPIAPSTFDEHTPDFSPDGKRLVFASTRTGVEELWVSDAGGQNPVQMTSMGGPHCANPRWSPDGRTIVFSSDLEGSRDLFLLSPGGGELRRITNDPAIETEPSWSRDGRTIYFASNRTGRLETWKMPSGGGAEVRITKQGGGTAAESPDGSFLYYSKGPPQTPSIWRVPVAGGTETPIVEGLSYSLNFAVADRGLYFLAVGDAPHKTSIDFFEFATGKRTTLLDLGKQWWYGMALSRDQRSLLYSTVDSAGSNLMLVDKFQ